MSRKIRTLKPEIIEDEKIGPLSDGAFRLIVSMITLADDHGNARADVRWLAHQIWWAHDHPPNVLKLLIELSGAGLIDVYGVRGGTYAHLKGFHKHQRIDNAGKSKVPPPNDADALDISLANVTELTNEPVQRETFAEKSATFPVISRNPPLDRIGREGKGEDVDAAARSPQAKPRKVATLIPADWSPRSEERAKAVSAGLDCDTEVEAFKDHHNSRGNRFLDHDAAFRTWLRNAKKFAKPQQQGSFLNSPTRVLEELK